MRGSLAGLPDGTVSNFAFLSVKTSVFCLLPSTIWKILTHSKWSPFRPARPAFCQLTFLPSPSLPALLALSASNVQCRERRAFCPPNCCGWLSLGQSWCCCWSWWQARTSLGLGLGFCQPRARKTHAVAAEEDTCRHLRVCVGWLPVFPMFFVFSVEIAIEIVSYPWWTV